MSSDYNDCEDKLIGAHETIDLLRENLGELLALPYIGLYPAGGWRCEFCKQLPPESGVAEDYPHALDCPIARARRLLEETKPNDK